MIAPTRNLTVFHGIGAIAATLLGSGLFIVPAISATLAGSEAMIAWIVMSCAIMPIAYVFGALGKACPHMEGSAYFVHQAFGERAGKFVGYLFISVIPIGPPVVILTGATYLDSLVGQGYETILAYAIIVIIFVLNRAHFSVSAGIGSVVSLAIAGLIAFVAIAAAQLPATAPVPTPQGGVIAAIGVVFWCYVGIEAMSHLSGEFRHSSDFLLSVVIGVVVVGILYSLATYGVMKFGAYGEEGINMNSLIIIGDRIGGRDGVVVISVIGFLICLIAANLYIASSSRLISSYSKGSLSLSQALLFSVAMITATISIKFLIQFKIELLIGYANGVFVAIYMAVTASGIRLLRGFGRIAAILGTVFLLAIVAVIGGQMIYVLGVLGVLGLSLCRDGFARVR
ncbi:MAG: L-methionine/branched-chain amino acid transporter [Rhodocyclaceae bacterium]